MTLDTAQLLGRLDEMFPESMRPLSLHEPEFRGKEWEYVRDCIDSGWVSSVGAYVDRFEQMLAEITGCRRAVAVMNGTAALHASLVLAGVEPGDEVLIPALTFIATANAVAYCHAVPHFVDSDPATLGMDVAKLGEYLEANAEVREGRCFNRTTGRRIPAIIPMHTYGHPVEIEPLIDLCERYSILVIEDAAESLGSYYGDKHTGTFGFLGTLSFNGNKIVTTGGGGAILTNDEELGRRAKHLTTTAKVPHPWAFVHDRVGFNYRLPNLNAALGCAQLELLDGFIAAKRALAEQYVERIGSLEGVTVFRERENTRSNYWLNVLLLDEENAGLRDDLLRRTNESGLMTRPAWTLMKDLPMYEDAPSMDLSGARSLERRLINLPSSSRLGERYL